MDNPENPQYCRHFWGRIERDMLEAEQSVLAEIQENNSSVLVHIHDQMKNALNIFMQYSIQQNSWRRLESADTRMAVDVFCRNVMLCVSWGRGEIGGRWLESVWLHGLQRVMRTAQEMFQNINKEITVCIWDHTGHGDNMSTPTPHIINAEHTLQEAIRQEYGVFPGRCQLIQLRRPVYDDNNMLVPAGLAATAAGVNTRPIVIFERPNAWRPDYTQRDKDEASAFFKQCLHMNLRTGDEVTIILDGRKPGGPNQVDPDYGRPSWVGPMDDPWNWAPNASRMSSSNGGPDTGRDDHTLAEMRTLLQQTRYQKMI